nr:unnamed protein product [Callosobruchus chinensis]
MCETYLLTLHKEDLLRILRADDTCKHYSIHINFIVLLEHQPTIIDQLLKNPEDCLQNLDDAAIKSQLSLLNESDETCKVKSNTHCRIYHLPEFPKMKRFIFPCSSDADKFLQISGTVMRVTAAKLLEYQRHYICVKCKTSAVIQAEYDRNYVIKQPKKCLTCFGSNLVNLGELDNENCKDFQEIKIQEDVKRLGVGSIPDTIWVTLEDDLVDTCKPGDNVTICGVLKRRWSEFDKGKKIMINLALKANHIQVDNNTTNSTSSSPEIKELFDNYWKKCSENPLEGRDTILKSLCPQLYGLYLVKLAIAVILAGGCQSDVINNTGIRTRSEAHLLLVGDPGTGKSQLLRFASKIVPRSVLTTGVGSTAAGLTVTAMMEQGEWQLEAGALVMADGGICCIDEFNSMKEHDRTSIHEAMEQQSISVAKASIICKLNTRCSILAACNPKGNLDLSQPLWLNIALPSPLLSRFDLVMLLKDSVNETWDDKVADYVLNEGHTQSKLLNSNIWTTDMLQSYIARIKRFSPRLSEESETILSAYYQMQRSLDGRNKARTTVRLLESLVRLSQGHARLMYHETVEVIDSIYAIVLVDTAMENESSLLSLNVSTNSVFPERPDVHYKTVLTTILEKLQLLEILETETSKLTEKKTCGRIESRFFHKHSSNGSSDESHKIADKSVEKTSSDLKRTVDGVHTDQKSDSKVSDSSDYKFEGTNGTKKISTKEKEDFQGKSHERKSDIIKAKKLNTDKSQDAENYSSNFEKMNKNLKISEDFMHKSDVQPPQCQTLFKIIDNGGKTTKLDLAQNQCEKSDKNKLFQSIYEDRCETIEPRKIKSSNQKGKDSDTALKDDQLHTNTKKGVKHPNVVNSDGRKDNIAKIDKDSKCQSKRKLLKEFKFIRRNKDTVEPDATQKAGVFVDDMSPEKFKPTSSECGQSDLPINDRIMTASDRKGHSSTSINSEILVSNNEDRTFESRTIIEDNFDSNSSRSKRKRCRAQIEAKSHSLEEASNCDVPKLHDKDLDVSKKPLNKRKSGSVKNDLDLMRFLPGVNDGFDLDLDIDWDDYDGATSIFSQNSKASSSSTLPNDNPVRCNFEQLDDDSDLDLQI